jgi:hypothetical protein
MQWPKEKGVKSGALKGQAVPAPLVTLVANPVINHE